MLLFPDELFGCSENHMLRIMWQNMFTTKLRRKRSNGLRMSCPCIFLMTMLSNANWSPVKVITYCLSNVNWPPVKITIFCLSNNMCLVKIWDVVMPHIHRLAIYTIKLMPWSHYVSCAREVCARNCTTLCSHLRWVNWSPSICIIFRVTFLFFIPLICWCNFLFCER